MIDAASGARPNVPSPREFAIRPVPHRTFIRPRGAGSEPGAVATPGPIDVICAGMYRACSTWQYEVVAHLLEHHRGGRRLGYLIPEEYVESVRRAPAASGWRVFKSHDADRCFARAIARRRAVAIYAYRDVRDVVFSLMHKRRLTFDELLRQGMIHQVLANDRFWTRRPGVLIQRYDAILADPVGAVRELARHLGIEPARGEAERIADEYSLEANKARTEALRRQLEQTGMDLNEAANSLICDPGTLLHWNHVRDGRAGSWIDEATPRQQVVLQMMCGWWLRAQGYPLAAEVPRTLGDRLRIEIEVFRGWLSFRSREAARHFPRLAAVARRVLGVEHPAQAGARSWSAAELPVGVPPSGGIGGRGPAEAAAPADAA